MTLFPITRPSLGLSITIDSISLVEIRRKWRSGTFRRCAQEPLPPGLLQLSPARPNITDLKVFSDILRVLSKGVKPSQPIVLSLPDLCARTAVFEFTSFPKKPAEREAILSWRFQQDLNLSTMNTRLAYHVYEPPKSKYSLSHNKTHTTRVFATTLQHTIIEQYEQACLQAGLLPNTVGLSSLDVFDLYRSAIQGTMQAASNRSALPSRESFFLYLTNWGFSFIAFRDHCPMFVRVKSLRLPRVDQRPTPQTSSEEALPPDKVGRTEDVAEQDSPLPDYSRDQAPAHEKAYTSEVRMMFANELVATLQYYFESFPTITDEGKPQTLFFIEGLEQGATLLPEVQEVEQMLRSSMAVPPPITIVSLPEQLTTTLHPPPNVPAHDHFGALPAYASVMVA